MIGIARAAKSSFGGWVIRIAALACLAVLSQVTSKPPVRVMPVGRIDASFTVEAVSGVTVTSKPFSFTDPNPTPLDVDKDGTADLLVQGKLVHDDVIDPNSIIPQVFAPNIEIRRAHDAINTNRPPPPVQLIATISIKDKATGLVAATVKFGYDTGGHPSVAGPTPTEVIGGSIPPYFNARLRGLENLFNPIQVHIDTIAPSSLNNLLSPTRAPAFEGPLTLIGGIDNQGTVSDFRIRYSPLPNRITVRYDEIGNAQHFAYSHNAQPNREVNATATATVDELGTTKTSFDARIDRIPRTMSIGLTTTSETGSFHLITDPDGRPPDVHLSMRKASPKGIDNVTADIGELPKFASGDWLIPDNGPARVNLRATERGIGSAELRVANFDGAPVFKEFIPDERQYLNVQKTRSGDQLMTARLEQIREIYVSQTVDSSQTPPEINGFDSKVRVGDGVKPLTIHLASDERLEGKDAIEATATVSPLPSSTVIGFRELSNGVTFTYGADRPVGVRGRVEVLGAKTALGAQCGSVDTTCTDFDAQHIPLKLDGSLLKIGDKDRVSLDAAAPDSQKTDLKISLTKVTPTETLVADAGLKGLPEFTRIQSVKGDDGTVKSFDAFACPWDFSATQSVCGNSTPGEIGVLEFHVRNFLTPPQGFPETTALTPPFVNVSALGRAAPSTDAWFEAMGHLEGIEAVQFIKDAGITGMRTIGGGAAGAALQARVDMRGIQSGYRDLGDVEITETAADTFASATVKPLPPQLDLCLREPANSLPSASVNLQRDFTRACEVRQPFQGVAITATAFSAQYTISGGSGLDPTVDSEVRSVVAGKELKNGIPCGAIEPRNLEGSVHIDHLPIQLTTHLLLPVQTRVASGSTGTTCGSAAQVIEVVTSGPVRGLYTTTPPAVQGAPQVNLQATGKVTTGDAECGDPRPDASAVCFSASLENLPTATALYFDPDKTELTDCSSDKVNMCVSTTAAQSMNVRDLRVTSVKPSKDHPGRQDALVFSGDVIGIPRRVFGTLTLPKPSTPGQDTVLPQFDINGVPEVGLVDLTVQNFISAPPNFPIPPGQRTGITDPADRVLIVQRGDAVRALAKISKLTRAQLLNDPSYGTYAGALGFTQQKDIRVYLDLDSGTSQKIADVTLLQLPTAASFCFRAPHDPNVHKGNPPHAHPQIGSTGGYCDPTGARPEGTGVFQFKDLSGAGTLDVHAYLRQRHTPGDVNSLKADIYNIPPLVRGTFTATPTAADVGGYLSDETTETGIDRIDFHLATFDLPVAEIGYQTLPFEHRPDASHYFWENKGTPNQHIGLVMDGADVQIRGRIGELPGSGKAGSEFKRLRLSDDACNKPESTFGTRPDYPYYPPKDSKTKYTCARVDFVSSTAADQLDLHVHFAEKGKPEVVDVTRSGLTEIPAFIQLTLARTPTLDMNNVNRPLRKPCGTTQDPSCMPPLLRFDRAPTPGVQPILFANIGLGIGERLERLADVVPLAALARLSHANASGWDGDTSSLATDTGIRGKIGISLTETSDFLGAAADLGARIVLPESFTLDQVQAWSKEQISPDESARDIRLHYAAKDVNGKAVQRLGHLAALVHFFPDGSQILLSDGAEVGTTRPGLDIPGELEVKYFGRTKKELGRDFMQLEGMASQDLDLRARVIKGPKQVGGIGELQALVLNLPGVTSTVFEGTPTFRVRSELAGPPEDPKDHTSCPSVFLCLKAHGELKMINLILDFKPDPNSPPARLVKAMTRFDGPVGEQGIQLQAFKNVDGDGPSFNKPPDAHITANASLDVTPISLFFHLGFIPIIGSADGYLLASLQATVSAEKVKEATIKHHLFRLKSSNRSDLGGKTAIGPVDFDIYVLRAEAWLLFTRLLGLEFIPPSIPFVRGPPGLDPVAAPFYDCSSFGKIVGGSLLSALPGYSSLLGLQTNNGVLVPANGSVDSLLWPFDDTRLKYRGLLGTVLGGNFGNVTRGFLKPFFCAHSPTATPLITSEHPGDPMAIPDHKVPDAPATSHKLSAMNLTQSPSTATLTVKALETKKMCGEHSFDSVKIEGMGLLEVASSAFDDSATPYVECAAADVDRLSITSVTITVDGQLKGEGVYGFSSSSGNGGGSHATSGGGGSNGSSGPTYGNLDMVPHTETGQAGGGSGSNGGGGEIILSADKVVINGEVSANGNAGGDNADQCGLGAREGGGGGAGGGIVITTNELHIGSPGILSAAGGNGGSGSGGGGGGGAGGVVKVFTAIYTKGRQGLPDLNDWGASEKVFTPGGEGGDDNGCGKGDGGDGDQGRVRGRHEPAGRVESPQKFWHNSNGLTVPISAAAQVNSQSSTIVVFLCGKHLSAQDGSTKGLEIPMPSTFATGKCGDGAERLSVQHFYPNTSRVRFDVSNPGSWSTIEPDMDRGQSGIQPLKEGYWGLWTRTFKPLEANSDCLGSAKCKEDTQPDHPDLIIGVDNSAPGGAALTFLEPVRDLSIVGPNTAKRDISFSIGKPIDQQYLSGPVSITCMEVSTTNPSDKRSFDCAEGGNAWSLLTQKDGRKDIVVEVADAAGNTTTETYPIILDGDPGGSHSQTPPDYVPTGTATAPAPAAGRNNWHATAPNLKLENYKDPAPKNGPTHKILGTQFTLGSGAFPDLAPGPFWAYRFDEGEEKTCSAVTCTVTDFPGTGTHVLHFTAIDPVGNRYFDDDDSSTPTPMATYVLKIDGEPPTSTLVTVPNQPSASSWFSRAPWIVLTALDQPGGSGLVPGPNEQLGAGIYWSKNGGSWSLYTKAFRADPGDNNYCWYAQDVASNNDQSNPQCRRIKVDVDDPMTTIVLPTPNGANGWYKTSPTVTISAVDPGGSRSISSTFISKNRGITYTAYSAPFTLDDGRHHLRAFSFDGSGRRSRMVSATVMVDGKAPESIARTLPELAAASDWYREVPRVVLRASDGDRSSGVRAIEFSTDNGATWKNYERAFRVPSTTFQPNLGTYLIKYRSVDVAGNTENSNELRLKVDVTPPKASALISLPASWTAAAGPDPAGTKVAKLSWTATDDLSQKLRVKVVVYEAALVQKGQLGAPDFEVDRGDVIVEIDAGSRANGAGDVSWDGTKNNANGPKVRAGTYYFRVVVTDEAGNVTHSGESQKIQLL